MKILYDSGEVHDAIKSVLNKEGRSQRRVVVVAYIGKAAEAYLPFPEDLEIVCCLKPMATSPTAIDSLRRRGAKLFKSATLHAKVYWSSNLGCVITSANASAAALAKNGNIEVGVRFPRGVVDINRIIKSARPSPISLSDIKKLHRETDWMTPLLNPNTQSRKSELVSFDQWLASAKKPWKLGWWDEVGVTAKSARAESLLRYGTRSPYDYISGSKDQYVSKDWVLSFKVGGGKPSPDWLYIDFVVKVDKNDKKAYEQNDPFQAVQAQPSNRYPHPPFDVQSKRFKRAFEKTVKDFGEQRFRELDTVKPPLKLIRLLEKHFLNESRKERGKVRF